MVMADLAQEESRQVSLKRAVPIALAVRADGRTSSVGCPSQVGSTDGAVLTAGCHGWLRN